MRRKRSWKASCLSASQALVKLKQKKTSEENNERNGWKDDGRTSQREKEKIGIKNWGQELRWPRRSVHYGGARKNVNEC